MSEKKKEKKEWRMKSTKTSDSRIIISIFKEIKEGNQNMNKKQKAKYMKICKKWISRKEDIFNSIGDLFEYRIREMENS